ncbi:hypothetical protein A2U01_0032726, partial [Trifolium medium]|nr:hypothetical protein [Trifolium medium]
MKLQNDGDVRTKFSIFSQHSTKGPVELYAMLVRSIQDCSVRGPLMKSRREVE